MKDLRGYVIGQKERRKYKWKVSEDTSYVAPKINKINKKTKD